MVTCFYGENKVKYFALDSLEMSSILIELIKLN